MPSDSETSKSNFADVFDAENHFYRRCSADRISKFLAHAKLYEMSLGLPGHFAEAGVFKGSSFCRFRKLGRLFHPDHTRRFVGFDVFGKFPTSSYEPDTGGAREAMGNRREPGDIQGGAAADAAGAGLGGQC